MSLAIEATALSKTYRLGFLLNRTVQALSGLNLRIEPGQVFGLLGPNGAGKSTTIKILLNLVRASSGTASIFGQSPTSRFARRDLGFVPENPAPYEYLTGREFVTLAGRLSGLTRHDLDKRVTEVLADVEMADAAGLQIRRYSKGMIQRVVLAQALVHRPRLLILDEPTSGLDPVGRRQIRNQILAERDRGTTILFCTHIIPDVEAVCDRVAVLVKGRQVKEGSVQELLTAQVPLMEIHIQNVTSEFLASHAKGIQTQELAGRWVLQVPDSEVQALIQKVIAHGGQLLRAQPARFSLEDLFMKTLEEAQGGTVGGRIS